jgi:hypothetical protein
LTVGNALIFLLLIGQRERRVESGASLQASAVRRDCMEDALDAGRLRDRGDDVAESSRGTGVVRAPGAFLRFERTSDARMLADSVRRMEAFMRR